MKNGGGSYLSAHDPREVLGIGAAAKIDSLEVQWPQPSGRENASPTCPWTATCTLWKVRVRR